MQGIEFRVSAAGFQVYPPQSVARAGSVIGIGTIT